MSLDKIISSHPMHHELNDSKPFLQPATETFLLEAEVLSRYLASLHQQHPKGTPSIASSQHLASRDDSTRLSPSYIDLGHVIDPDQSHDRSTSSTARLQNYHMLSPQGSWTAEGANTSSTDEYHNPSLPSTSLTMDTSTLGQINAMTSNIGNSQTRKIVMGANDQEIAALSNDSQMQGVGCNSSRDVSKSSSLAMMSSLQSATTTQVMRLQQLQSGPAKNQTLKFKSSNLGTARSQPLNTTCHFGNNNGEAPSNTECLSLVGHSNYTQRHRSAMTSDVMKANKSIGAEVDPKKNIEDFLRKHSLGHVVRSTSSNVEPLAYQTQVVGCMGSSSSCGAPKSSSLAMMASLQSATTAHVLQLLQTAIVQNQSGSNARSQSLMTGSHLANIIGMNPSNAECLTAVGHRDIHLRSKTDGAAAGGRSLNTNSSPRGGPQATSGVTPSLQIIAAFLRMRSSGKLHSIQNGTTTDSVGDSSNNRRTAYSHSLVEIVSRAREQVTAAAQDRTRDDLAKASNLRPAVRHRFSRLNNTTPSSRSGDSGIDANSSLLPSANLAGSHNCVSSCSGTGSNGSIGSGWSPPNSLRLTRMIPEPTSIFENQQQATEAGGTTLFQFPLHSGGTTQGTPCMDSPTTRRRKAMSIPICHNLPALPECPIGTHGEGSTSSVEEDTEKAVRSLPENIVKSESHKKSPIKAPLSLVESSKTIQQQQMEFLKNAADYQPDSLSLWVLGTREDLKSYQEDVMTLTTQHTADFNSSVEVDCQSVKDINSVSILREEAGGSAGAGTGTAGVENCQENEEKRPSNVDSALENAAPVLGLPDLVNAAAEIFKSGDLQSKDKRKSGTEALTFSYVSEAAGNGLEGNSAEGLSSVEPKGEIEETNSLRTHTATQSCCIIGGWLKLVKLFSCNQRSATVRS